MDGQREAVVIGGSMAGLMAAAVLSRRYQNVTVLDRDSFPEQPVHRAGVPQGVHLHVLLDRGYQILERMFPHMGADLAAAGAVEMDAGLDLDWFTPQGQAPRFRSGSKIIACSRPLIEWMVRKRVAALPNVRFVERVEVTGLTSDLENTRVSGLTFRSRSESMHLPLHRSADLVVDASGRGSHMPQWLSRLNLAWPRETSVNGHMGYATRLYHRNPDRRRPFRAVFSQAAPPRLNRAGIAYPIEGDRWIVSLSGGDSDYPPTDEQGFTAYAASLPNPHIHMLATTCRPLGSIVGFRGGENRLRHYEEIAMPRGVVVLGDAACAFNPVYGQGMTVAAAGAAALAECLDRDAPDTFQKRLAKAIQTPWMLATGEDMRFANVEGAKRDWRLRLTHAYMDRVVALSLRDVGVRRKLFDVMNLTSEPSALLSVTILAKILGDMVFPHPSLAYKTHSGARTSVKAALGL